MGTIINNFSALYNLLSHKYQCSANLPEEREECYQLLSKVFEEELGHEGEMAFDKDIHSSHILLSCRNQKTGMLVGCIQATPASYLLNNTEYQRIYNFSSFPLSLLERTAVVDRLAVVPAYRNSEVSLFLLHKLLQYGIENNYLLSLSVCEPMLYRMYHRLGARPYRTPVASPFGGYYIPLYLDIRNNNLLRWTNPTRFYQIKKQALDQNLEVKTWFLRFQEEIQKTDFRIQFLDKQEEKNFQSSLLKDFSPQGRHEILQNAILIKTVKEDLLLKEGEGAKNIFLIKSGEFEKRSQDRLIARLKEGDIFGEESYLLKTPQTYSIYSSSSFGEIIGLSNSSIKSLSLSADKVQFEKNLAHYIVNHSHC